MADEPLCPGPGDWYKDAVLYQVHLKSFADGNGDGMGDFKGLIAKLDYLEDLGVTALWLLPFYPSPMRDDGYDISDYTRVHPDYGTLGDFKRLLREAHKRGLRVITELVLNHTSDQHPWFRKARTAKPGTSAREFYVWSDDPERYPEARVIFRDFERSNWTWDDQAKAYYWHRFYSHQPDLNYDNPRVREAMLRILDFWFELGVDGIRLDAVNYLYEREGTNCENLPENHEFLRQARRHVDERFPGRVLLAESNQWPEDAAKYFGRGDECHMAFHFPLMPRLFMALETENRYPVIDILEQTPSVSEACQWALFLRNHDELTLEMVTDEERDYMYRIYVADPRARVNLGIRRRLAPLLDNDRRKIELMNVLLMTLPGSPIIYYGDEIGMGDNFYLGDRDGVRTPMQWNGDQNAGFSPANPQKLYLPLVIDPVYHYGSLNVDTQEGRRSSLLWWMRHLIALRRNYCCFGRGDIRFLAPDNPKVLAFVRTFQGERVLVAVNLSRHSQSATLELSEFAGHTPRDAFSRNPFPQVGEAPYSLTLTPHGYYILELRAPDEGEAGLEAAELPRLQASTWWGLPEDKRMRRRMEHAVLPRYMRGQRWFGGKARVVRDVSVLEWIHIRRDEQTPIILLVEVSYQEGDPEIYVLPVAFAPKAPGDETYELPRGSMAWLEMEGAEGAVYEAVFSSRFCRDLFRIMAGRKRLSGHSGRLMAASGKLLRTVAKLPEEELDPRLLGAEQSNTSILYGQQLILKLYRRTEKGTHPDVELARFLTEKAGFAHTPPFAGSAEHRREDGGVVMLGLMQGYVPNQGDAWDMTQDMVRRYFERVLTDADSPERPPAGPSSLMRAAEQSPPDGLRDIISPVALDMAELLGRRTGQLHLALASDRQDENFAPEPFSSLYQRSLYQSMQNQAKEQLRFLRRKLPSLPRDVAREAEAVAGMEMDLLARLGRITARKLTASKIRIHGDYHLGQVLSTGSDFVIFDFEGEPVRPLSERRLKRSPVRDVAGMIRSYHYAAFAALLSGLAVREKDAALLEPWADLWYKHSCGAFLRGYLETVRGSGLAPDDEEGFENLLVPYLLEKAVYEMGYEMNNRPAWLVIPLRGIAYLCGGEE